MVEGQLSAVSSQPSVGAAIRYGMMVRTRTRALLALSLLAPVSRIVWHFNLAAMRREYTKAGEIGTVWAEPGALFYIVFFAGIASFLSGVISLALDMRSSRK